MRPEGNSLDLNNLPEEHAGKQPLEESSMTTAASADTTRFKKKKSGGKDDSAKVYECRFCSLKFCKSQALGGHMNRHRQERETETLNRARQLVFNNESIGSAGAIGGFRDLNLGGSQFPHGGGGGIGDPCLQFRPVYPRIPTQPPISPQTQQFIYPSSSSHSLPTIRRPTNLPSAITTSAMSSREAPTVSYITPATVLIPASLASELLLLTAFSGKEEMVHLEVMGMSNTWIPLLSGITFTGRWIASTTNGPKLLSRVKMEGTGMRE